MTAAGERIKELAILPDREKRQIPDRHQPLLAALSSQTYDSVRLVQVIEIDPHDLAHPSPGRVHRFQQGTITQGQGRLPGRKLHECRCIVLCQHARKWLW